MWFFPIKVRLGCVGLQFGASEVDFGCVFPIHSLAGSPVIERLPDLCKTYIFRKNGRESGDLDTFRQ